MKDDWGRNRETFYYVNMVEITELIEELEEYAEGIETEEEMKALIEEMEERWAYRDIDYRLIEAAIEQFTLERTENEI